MMNRLSLYSLQSCFGSITAQLGIATLLYLSIFFGLLVWLQLTVHLGLMLFAGSISVLLAPIFAKVVSKPLRSLLSGIQALAEEQFIPQKSLVKAAKGFGLMSRLAQSFLGMAEKIQQREFQLQKEVDRLHLQIDGAWQAEVLLKELLSNDVQWLADVGNIREIDMGQRLTWSIDLSENVYVLLEGLLTLAAPEMSTLSPLLDKAIKLSSGELLGYLPLQAEPNRLEECEALEPTLLWAIPRSVLNTKMTYDSGFAVRFKKAAATLLSRRLARLSRQHCLASSGSVSSFRDVLFMLGEFNDSDIDWLVAKGEQKKVLGNTVLIQDGGPIDGLYIVLEGSLALIQSARHSSPLVHNLLPRPAGQNQETLVRHLYKGELFGVTPFIDTYQPTKIVKALEDCLVLYVPRQHLMVKLDQDAGFAARFYEVVISILDDQLQTRFSQQISLSQFDPDVHFQKEKTASNEIDFRTLDQMAIAGTRFNWMIGRLSGTDIAQF